MILVFSDQKVHSQTFSSEERLFFSFRLVWLFSCYEEWQSLCSGVPFRDGVQPLWMPVYVSNCRLVSSWGCVGPRPAPLALPLTVYRRPSHTCSDSHFLWSPWVSKSLGCENTQYRGPGDSSKVSLLVSF